MKGRGGTNRTLCDPFAILWVLANGKSPSVFPISDGVEGLNDARTKLADFFSILLVADCHFQEGYASLCLPSRRGLAVRWREINRPAASMLPCPRISSEVRPKSPRPLRLWPAPSPVPRAQDNVIILKGGTPDGFKDLCWWVALFGDRAGVE